LHLFTVDKFLQRSYKAFNKPIKYRKELIPDVKKNIH